VLAAAAQIKAQMAQTHPADAGNERGREGAALN
jgi:hypothetical protein